MLFLHLLLRVKWYLVFLHLFPWKWPVLFLHPFPRVNDLYYFCTCTLEVNGPCFLHLLIQSKWPVLFLHLLIRSKWPVLFLHLLLRGKWYLMFLHLFPWKWPVLFLHPPLWVNNLYYLCNCFFGSKRSVFFASAITGYMACVIFSPA